MREHISNNNFKKIDIYKKFEKNAIEYIILGWNSVCWPTKNKSVNILEETLRKFKTINIPFQYVLLNEKEVTDIKIMQFIETDKNVDVFLLERKIKIKNLKN